MAPTELSTRTKFPATEAALTAIARPVVETTRPQDRILRAATALWCQGLQFPTVREIAAAAGYRSASSGLRGFPGLLDVHATVIAGEWRLLEERWFSAEPGERRPWLAEHARELAAHHPSMLRLPGLVCSAVLASGAVRPLPPPDLTAPLHALAALADAGDGQLDLHVLPAFVAVRPDAAIGAVA